MKTCTVLVLSIISICINFPVINCWIGVEQFDEKSDHSSHCYTDTGKIGEMDKGDVKRIPKMCAIATCNDNRDVQLTGCSPMDAAPPCRVAEGKLSDPFPKCCYQIICGEENQLDEN